MQNGISAFMSVPSIKLSTTLNAKKQSRSSLLQTKDVEKPSNVKSTIQTPTESEKEDEEVFGAKFFGGNAIKDELLDESIEEQAVKLATLYPKKSKIEDEIDSEIESTGYKRFDDSIAFDLACRDFAKKLQKAINQALYTTVDGEEVVLPSQIYSSNLKWETPLSKSNQSKNPLDELTYGLDFYKRVDVAVTSAKLQNGDGTGKVEKVKIRWEISLLWPNTWESRVLIPGTSDLTVDMEQGIILSQTDKLECGGKDGQDAVAAISSQIQPRFWDLYHIGMTPSAEIMQRAKASVEKGAFSKYNVFEIPERLVLKPRTADQGGREARQAEALPNHAFTSIIKTTGPKAQRYITTSPVEVAILRENDKSIIEWKVPVPAEFVSNYDEMPIGDLGDVDEDDTCEYSYESRRLVATMSFGGSAQDKEVSDVRKQLYEQVTKDGLKPKLVNGRPQFFFLNNDAKACFTGDGGLGMAVYEWRTASSKSNEVGIDLEL